jgi:hypothetical protein
LVSAAFQLPPPENNDNLFLTGPYASFVGKIYEAIEQNENDCKFGVTLSEYNNFSFGNKAKMDFKIQVVYEAGPNSRFKKLAPRLSVGKLVYISGFFDLNENEFPFIEAKEIDLLDDFSNTSIQNQPSITLQSPFSRANKFRSSTNRYMVQQSDKSKETSNSIEIADDDDAQTKIVNTENEDEMVVPSTFTSGANNKATGKTKKNNKRKELADLSIRRLSKSARTTKVKTRSQQEEQPADDMVLTEPEDNI